MQGVYLFFDAFIVGAQAVKILRKFCEFVEYFVKSL